ncbi:hypothetical protein DMH04_34355 [Kibdelosporangium aridum]|uniref:Uncharacterized protein n=1 Tax=Kibdelosporangium aridum TaxID=2030 RepID=A0A428Z0P5_KIBAR|nr:hypothetical protein DMH04_34355 [Kibdelosporangium aridum]
MPGRFSPSNRSATSTGGAGDHSPRLAYHVATPSIAADSSPDGWSPRNTASTPNPSAANTTHSQPLPSPSCAARTSNNTIATTPSGRAVRAHRRTPMDS